MKHYCTECCYAKYYECSSGLKIICTRPRIRSDAQTAITGTSEIFSIIKKLSSEACIHFKETEK